MAAANGWLMKSEQGDYSIDDFARDGKTAWTGVRNYQARNLMRDRMAPGDPVLFYHSNGTPPAVVGLARVTSKAYPDPTQFDPKSRYFDPKSTEAQPRWWLVDVEFVKKLPKIVPLAQIRAEPRLKDMVLLNRSRLSVQPVRENELQIILEMAKG
jgi:predicted RNA-binding protein with PUA-like domain